MARIEDCSFIPNIHQGKLCVVPKLQRQSSAWTGIDSVAGSTFEEIDLTLSGLARSIRDQSWLILEAPFHFERSDKLEGLFARTESGKISFRVLKHRVSLSDAMMKRYCDPNPYTDDHRVLLSFDDLMTIYLSL